MTAQRTAGHPRVDHNPSLWSTIKASGGAMGVTLSNVLLMWLVFGGLAEFLLVRLAACCIDPLETGVHGSQAWDGSSGPERGRQSAPRWR